MMDFVIELFILSFHAVLVSVFIFLSTEPVAPYKNIF